MIDSDIASCAYCDAPATTMDALGLPACDAHEHEADEYYFQRTGYRPGEDRFLYCDVHLDLWQPGCARCEECCQHHYGMSVAEMRTRISPKIYVLLPGADGGDDVVYQVDTASLVDEHGRDELGSIIFQTDDPQNGDEEQDDAH